MGFRVLGFRVSGFGVSDPVEGFGIYGLRFHDGWDTASDSRGFSVIWFKKGSVTMVPKEQPRISIAGTRRIAVSVSSRSLQTLSKSPRFRILWFRLEGLEFRV